MSKKDSLNGREWSKKEITFVRSKFKQGFSRYEISKLFSERFSQEGWKRSPDSIKHCIEVYCQDIEKYIPKLLYIDVETKPMKAYVWGQWENNVDLPMLIEDGSILSFCAKWAGDKKVIYKDQRGKEKNLMDDKSLISELRDLMDEADIICWQNGDKFDKGKINARFIEHGLEAPSYYKTIDTLKLARNNFNFFSNKLAHLSNKLAKKSKKSSHSEFPGFTLWDECMKGNKKAWNSMKKYNILDVLALEEVFLELAKYVKNNKTVTDALRVYKK